MNHKNLLGAALVAALAFGANAASACAISAWSSATGLTVADTGEPAAGFSRYSGRCSLRVPSFTAGGRFVQDNTPNNEVSYRARFYYYTGDISGAETDIFQARNTGGTNIIRITHDGSALRFYTNTGGAAQSVTVADSKYYSVELAWAAGTVTPATTGTFTATVTGNNSTTPAGTANFTGLANSADSITDARLGLIAAATTPTVTAPVYFDEFDSRRTTNPGRLCRGDANNDTAIGSADRIVVTNEILSTGSTPAIGQPDANEDGFVASADRIVITNLILAGATCN
jgi:hypothetical protein